jgi:hypothetical protein
VPIQHVVQPGEHLSGIAEQYGFRSYKTLWDFGDNADLKQSRDNPHVLMPGDVVNVPDPQTKDESAPTGQSSRFQVPTSGLRLRIKLLDAGRSAITGTQTQLSVEGNSTQPSTDGDGLVEQTIPASAHIARLVVEDADFSMQIGALNPLPDESGWEARLNNLGYLVPPADDRDDDELRSALEEFQCDYGLQLTGEEDDATKAKLLEVFGV